MGVIEIGVFRHCKVIHGKRDGIIRLYSVSKHAKIVSRAVGRVQYS